MPVQSLVHLPVAVPVIAKKNLSAIFLEPKKLKVGLWGSNQDWAIFRILGPKLPILWTIVLPNGPKMDSSILTWWGESISGPHKIPQTAICRDPRKLETNGSNSKKSAESPENSRAQISENQNSKFKSVLPEMSARSKLVWGMGSKIKTGPCWTKIIRAQFSNKSWGPRGSPYGVPIGPQVFFCNHRYYKGSQSQNRNNARKGVQQFDVRSLQHAKALTRNQ